METKSLFGLTKQELFSKCEKYNLRPFVLNQICEWFYKKMVFDYDKMTNLPKPLREKLKTDYPTILIKPISFQISKDGTKKYLFEYSNDRFIETAVIPDDDRITVCVSSQVGCKLACVFCATGKNGFHGNLSAGEIINQLMSIDEYDKITNIVFMGMGEPLDNWSEVSKAIEILTSEWGLGMSASRVTVSSVGLLENLKSLIEHTKVNIAISLHSPFVEERCKIMPIEKSNSFNSIIDLLSNTDLPRHRKLSFEYIMIKDFNMTKAHAKKLADLAMRCHAHINIIAYNYVPEINFVKPNEKDILDFQKELIKRGAMTTLRRPRGLDISAACGTLAGKKN